MLYLSLIIFSLFLFTASATYGEAATPYPRDNDEDYTESYYHKPDKSNSDNKIESSAAKAPKEIAPAPVEQQITKPAEKKQPVPAYPRDNDEDYMQQQYYYAPQPSARPAQRQPAYPQDNDQEYIYRQQYEAQQPPQQPAYATPEAYPSGNAPSNNYPADNDSDYKPPAQTNENSDNFYPAYY